MKPKHQRLLFVAFCVVSFSLAVLFALKAFRENIMFFVTPTELTAKPQEPSRALRLGGLVEKGSVVRGADQHITFNVTDGNATVTVHYTGILPSLFREGQGVVVEGVARDGFQAKTVLAKHDENYMPKEVVRALKESGHWETSYGGKK